jgi:chromosome segregation ATPase
MAKKQPPRRKLKKGPPRAQAKAKARPAKAKARPPKARPAKQAAAEQQLIEAMEELEVARQELSRLGHELTASHRAVEDCKLSSGSAEENLRGQMLALREELRTAMAELEISRNEIERLQKKLAQYEAASASKKPVGSSPSV